MGDQFFHKIMFFRAPLLCPKGPRPSRGQNLGSGIPKMVPGVENTKVAYRKIMQNPMVGIPNGAMCCKLRPPTILGPQCQIQVRVMGLCPTSACQNFRSWRNLDPGVSAWVEPAPLLAKTCSTPGLRPQAKTPGPNPRSGAWGRVVFSHVQGLLDPGKNA